jgi:hypothetical protein
VTVDAKPFWLFLHIPKTAGTTLRTVVEAQFGHDTVLTYYNQPSRQLLDNLPYLLRDERRSFRALIGHYPFGVHDGLPRPGRYITFMRDPARRVISDYHERCGRLPEEMSNGSGGLMTLEEALERHPSHYDNIQTRYLTGVWGRALDESDLDNALANLDAHFEFAGTVERFDEGLAALGKTLGWTDLSYERQNVGPKPPPPTSAAAERISALTTFDRALYDRVADR